MSIEHINIPDDQRHEAKGAQNALAGHVLFAKGDSTTEFREFTPADLPIHAVTIEEQDRAIFKKDLGAQLIDTKSTWTTVDIGGKQESPKGTVQVTNLNEIEFKTAGLYEVSINVVPHVTPAESWADLIFRVVDKNGDPISPTRIISIDNFLEQISNVQLWTTVHNASTGDKMVLQMAWVPTATTSTKLGDNHATHAGLSQSIGLTRNDVIPPASISIVKIGAKL